MVDAAGIILDSTLKALAEVPKQKRREVFSAALSELLNAGGVLMDGATVQSPLAESPPVVTEIAELLGNAPTPTRNKYYVYPFARPSISASGPFFYIDEANGELMVLLVRRIKDGHQWLYTAGYMEIMPTNAEKAYSERVSERARNKAEEATVGVHLDVPDDESPALTVEEHILPDARAVQYVIYEEFKRVSAKESWESAISKLSDIVYVRDLLQRHRIHWPQHVDYNSRAAFIREAAEEAGLDLVKYPAQFITMAKSMDTISVGSGGERLYNTDQLYFGYLGKLSAAPKLKPGPYEISEARWVPVSDIYHAVDRNQYIVEKDGRPLHFHGIQGLEYTLNGLLKYFIGQVSLVTKLSGQQVPLFHNPATIQAAIVHNAGNKFSVISDLLQLRIGHEGNLPSLVHKAGQETFRAFIAAASGLTAKKKGKDLAALVADAKVRPQALLELLS